MPHFSCDPDLRNITRGAIDRLHRGLSLHAPWLAAAAMEWMKRLSESGRPEDYFLGNRAPLLLLPDELARSVHASSDDRFRSDIAYSTIAGYYFVRLIDNVMDGRAAAETGLLPLLGFLHGQFQGVYMRYFPSGHAFWRFFESTWTAMAEATAQAASMTEFTAAEFARIVTAKFGGGKIPLAAVCLHYDRPASLDAWCEFYDAFACCSQMIDDVFDWAADSVAGTGTYFLSEAKRRRHDGESPAAWILREGLAWGYSESQRRLCGLREMAQRLPCDSLERYVEDRALQLRAVWEQLQPRLPAMSRLDLVPG
jgi:hypothetical protein